MALLATPELGGNPGQRESPYVETPGDQHLLAGQPTAA
jgi:hypothetical protein